MNDENLNKQGRFRPDDEATKEAGRKGGIASGVARSFRSAVKKRLKEHPEHIEEICTMLIEKALDGDMKALELLLELHGESPKQMEIALKKKDLKLREKQAEQNNW